MIEFNLNKYLIDINCPKCSKIISESIESLKSDRTIICPTCHDYFDIQTDELKKEIEIAETRVKDLMEALNKLVKK